MIITWYQRNGRRQRQAVSLWNWSQKRCRSAAARKLKFKAERAGISIIGDEVKPYGRAINWHSSVSGNPQPT